MPICFPKTNPNSSRLITEKPKSFIHSIVGFSVSSWIGFVIGIISVPILTRLLDPVQFAVINQFNTAVSFFLYLVTLGMDSALVRFFFEPPTGFTKKTLLGKCLGLSLMVLLVLALLSIPFYSKVANILFGIDNWIISLFFFVAIASQIIIRYFTIHYRMLNEIIAFTVVAVAVQLITKFAVLSALPFKGDKVLLLAANTIGILILSLAIFFTNIKNQTFSWSPISLWKIKEFTKYSLGSWLVPVVIFGNLYFTQVIVRHFAGEKILGIYLSGYIFAGILAVVQTGFTNYWSAYMFENYSKNQNLIKKIHDYVSLFCILAICGFILTKDILYVFIGSQFQTSKPIFALIIASPLFILIGETTAYGISILKKAHVSLFSYLSFFVLNLVLAFILVPIWGMLGAGLALMISSLINLIIQTYYGQKYYRSVETLKRTFYAISVIVLLSLINFHFDGNQFATVSLVIIIILISIIVYFKQLKYAVTLIRTFRGNSTKTRT